MRTLLVVVAAIAAGKLAFAGAASSSKIPVINGDRQEIGEVTAVDTPNGVLIRLELKARPAKLTPGVHAVHIHEVGECVPPFKSAGAHFNPFQKKHGFLTKDGKHTGDLPNIHVPENAPLAVEFFVPQLTLKGDKTSLLDADGSALVIHQGADDYKSDPAGDSGERVACAAFARSGK
jgi:Cu-Zn family superoxide dismutase